MRKNVLYLLAVTLLISASCKKSDNPAPVPPAPDPVETVYTAGSLNLNGTITAVYWKDSALVKLGDETHESQATGIYVVGNDVHVCGVEYNGTFMEPKYWKNGVGQFLSRGHATGTSRIVVSGNDVYIAGHEKNDNGIWVAKYWKNGTAVTLQENATVSDLKIAGNDVYVAGTDEAAHKAVYWKNGQVVPLTAEGTSLAKCITINGSDVYVTGLDFKNPNTIPVYWKNAARTVVNGMNQIYDLDFAGSDMYVSGTVTDQNNAAYAYSFKNGTATKFTLGDGTYSSVCSDLFTLNGNVYGTGIVNTVYKPARSAVYWKNNKMVDLDKSLYGSNGNSIFVTVK